jgi:iron complex transport system permease protein
MTTQEETATPGDTVERPSSAGIVLAIAGLLWMAGLLWSARATITGRDDAAMEVTSTAYALPGAISASLVGGASVALAVLAAVGRSRTPGATLRFAIATGTGLILGLLGAVSIITINRDGWVYAVVGGTVAAAATIGGALAGFRASRVLAAVCWASIAVFAIGVLLNFVPWLDLFGSGNSTSSQFGAANWFSLTQRVLGGFAAGLVSFLSLRRARRRAGGTDVRWPWYALAGAGPGLLLIVAEGLARTAGARVLELAGKVSELETTVQQMLSGSRLNSALVVMFIGAITAIIAVGRTMGPRVDAAESADAEAGS